MTEQLFTQDAYLTDCTATVTVVHDMAVELDRTVFYAQGGGQPGDTGTLTLADGTVLVVSNATKGDTPGSVVHLIAGGVTPPPVGTAVTAKIDWARRHKFMRMHTCLHLLSAVLPYPVTGGSIGEEKGRLDFDLPEANLDKEDIAAKLAALIAADSPVSDEWITDAELDANPDLVKTMAVQPPRGLGKVRLLRIGDDVDLQPCGGTHVKRTGEIGAIEVGKIEKKGRQNRRVNLRFA
ncbi:MAG: alanyl-tRNA editing protein [Proteobacteria bacterium]|nr:alanyl-tRNA editing protein [Pseudomonadota bacterium]MDA1058864.1 alanyl-tRNA editing protein [Pseudomonadota bacterium]